MNQPLRIATRHSALAMWQAHHVASLLGQYGVATTIVPLVSQGDLDLSPIDGTRQIGLFTKRIQQALADNEADIAVHSLKDLPTEPNPRFTLAAVPKRETTADWLIVPKGLTMPSGDPVAQLPSHARVGTGSCRRAAQLRSVRPDLSIESIRGNVQTRLAKLEEESFDAILLAAAGLLRLEIRDVNHHPLSSKQMLPAPGQGALGIEVRRDDLRAMQAVGQLDDAEARLAVTAERHLLAGLHGGCLAPIAAHATVGPSTDVQPPTLKMNAVVLSQDGSQRIDLSDQVILAQHPSGNGSSCETMENNLPSAIEMATAMVDRFVAQGAIEMMGRRE